jgi:hypothetical protein
MIKYGVSPNADIQLSFMPVDIAPTISPLL